MVSSNAHDAVDISTTEFQSRNRGSFGFKKQETWTIIMAYATFQSRNRGSFGFKYTHPSGSSSVELTSGFQSRNRGSFGFKQQVQRLRVMWVCCFNLVIEVLLVSSTSDRAVGCLMAQFQSRNRGSFGFKAGRYPPSEVQAASGFNLVIEVLLVSSNVFKFIYQRLYLCHVSIS